VFAYFTQASVALIGSPSAPASLSDGGSAGTGDSGTGWFVSGAAGAGDPGLGGSSESSLELGIGALASELGSGFESGSTGVIGPEGSDAGFESGGELEELGLVVSLWVEGELQLKELTSNTAYANPKRT
jgi:hypothetical protein